MASKTHRRKWKWTPYRPYYNASTSLEDRSDTRFGYRATQGKFTIDVYQSPQLDLDGQKLWCGYILDINGGILITLFVKQRWTTGGDSRWEAQARFEDIVDLFHEITVDQKE